MREKISVVLLVCVLIVQALSAQTYTPPPNHRSDILLNSNWKFIQQNVSGAQASVFDDSTWTNVAIPHVWDIAHGQDGPSTTYYSGICWYRSHYTVSNSLAGRHFFLKFDGAFLVADVWINGNYLGEHQGGFSSFVFDATPYINVGADNVIAVEVNNSVNANVPPLSGDFTFWGGIYRDVHLLVTDPVQISPLDYGSPGVYLKTTGVSASSANLQVTAVVSNANVTPASIAVRAVVTDANTNIITILTNQLTLPAATGSNVVLSTTITNPHLWNGVSSPYLYQTFVEVDQGSSTLDLVSQPLGFRFFSVDPTNGFSLNGVHYDLHGVNMHQDWVNCGEALTNAQRDTNFAVFKQIGATFLRLAHYECNDYSYQLADRNGMCVWSEIPLVNYITESPGFYTNTLQQLRELVRQRYNHPSVICWGIYNEVTLQSGPTPTNLINQEVQVLGQEDTTRLSVAAAATSDGDPSTLYTQLIAFNKYYGWYVSPLNGIGGWADNFHTTYPTRCVGVSEYGAGASIFQHSENPSAPVTSGPFHPEEWQNIVHETNWLMMASRPYIWCKLVWNEFDFASDGRNEGDTPGRNDKGLVTYDHQTRKDAFYFYQANWTTNPMVYITGHTFTNRQANSIIAKVYANCDTVKLVVNGVSQGSRTGTNCIFGWPINLIPGSTNVVQAIGTKGTTNVTDSLIWIGTGSPPIISFKMLSATNLQLSWPTNNGTWSLQTKTNALVTGAGSQWTNVSGTISNPYVVPVSRQSGSVYYRLVQ